MVSVNETNYYTSDRECANIDNCNQGYKDTSDIESSKLENGMYTENRVCEMCDCFEYTDSRLINHNVIYRLFFVDKHNV